MADKYIKLKEAKDAIFDFICSHTMSKFPSKEECIASKGGAEGAMNELDYVPSYNINGAKHAYLHLHQDGSGTCSECGLTQNYIWDCDSWQNFCGHCGADMREGGD